MYNSRTSKRITAWAHQYSVRFTDHRILANVYRSAWRVVRASGTEGQNPVLNLRTYGDRFWWERICETSLTIPVSEIIDFNCDKHRSSSGRTRLSWNMALTCCRRELSTNGKQENDIS